MSGATSPVLHNPPGSGPWRANGSWVLRTRRPGRRGARRRSTGGPIARRRGRPTDRSVRGWVHSAAESKPSHGESTWAVPESGASSACCPSHCSSEDEALLRANVRRSQAQRGAHEGEHADDARSQAQRQKAPGEHQIRRGRRHGHQHVPDQGLADASLAGTADPSLIGTSGAAMATFRLIALLESARRRPS